MSVAYEQVRSAPPSLIDYWSTRIGQTPIRTDLDAVDFYCGMGGESTGLVLAGWRVKFAADHDRGEQQMQAGNAVPVNVAQMLGTRIAEGLDDRTAA